MSQTCRTVARMWGHERTRTLSRRPRCTNDAREPRTVGYARVSTQAQDESMQLDALAMFRVEEVYVDHGVSGARTSRPEA